jgi:apolipoprotein D and lipocalin family protein
MKNLSAAALWLILLAGCTGIPDGVTPVENFRLDRYLGKWYEIARLDHSFERGLSRVSAEYSLREDGGVNVRNRGYSEAKGVWKEARGKAYFMRSPDIGFLKVSFFGPFYGSYVVFDLDRENYRYALVCGPDLSYLWILSREPRLEPQIRERLLTTAAAAGFAADRLIFVDHE